MKLAIMQPYIFPYIGYFQLINAVDKLIIYDDVTYIKQGWINRNKILLNCKEHIFTVPLKNASSFVHIGQTEMNERLYGVWKEKFLKTLTQAYAKAPYYNVISELVATVLATPAANISELALCSLQATIGYIGLNTEITPSSQIYNNAHLKSQERVLDICKLERAETYINPVGGQDLYSKQVFTDMGIDLFLIHSRLSKYQQFRCDFVPYLSIIDVMMFNSPADILQLLQEYDLR